MTDDELGLTAEEEALREGEGLDGFDAEELLEEEDDEGEGDIRAAMPDMGPCCACGAEGARNVLSLDRRAPRPGTGWGCVVCGLRSDGALAVLCDDCVREGRPPIEVADGYLAARRRVPVEALPDGTFDHDPERHPGEAV